VDNQWIRCWRRTAEHNPTAQPLATGDKIHATPRVGNMFSTTFLQLPESKHCRDTAGNLLNPIALRPL
jgi:hypothetical protein